MRARRRRWNWRFRQAAARRRRFDDDGNKAFRERAFLGSAPRLSTPCEKLLRRRPVPTGHLRDNCVRLQGRLDRSRFLAVGPAPAPSAPARYHLNTASRRGVRVKRMVKSRHKPISKSGDYTHRTRVRPKGAAGTTLTLEHLSIVDGSALVGHIHPRQPSSGANIMNRLATPLRLYS
jgi:hypothetical protein